MKVSVMSDLHLEFGDLKGLPGGDVLLLAGDVFVADHMPTRSNNLKYTNMRNRYERFIQNELSRYDRVFYIAGNHEPYGSIFEESPKVIKKFILDNSSNVEFMGNDTCDLGDVVILGSTLWATYGMLDPARSTQIGNVLNDFKQIRTWKRRFWDEDSPEPRSRNWCPEDAYHEYLAALNWLTSQLDYFGDQGKKCIVMTHHAPSYLSNGHHVKSGNQMMLDDAFCSNQHHLIERNPHIVAWVHGHTHHNCDYKIGETRIISNQRGYHGYENLANEFNPSSADFNVD